MKRTMENVVVSRPREEPIGLGAKKFLVMRTTARPHECDERALLGSIDSTELEFHDILRDMISKDQVEASPARMSSGKRRTTFAPTLTGWGEYMTALGSLYSSQSRAESPQQRA